MTRARELQPTVRIVASERGELVAEVTARVLTLRPLRSRRGGPAEVTVTWGALFVRLHRDAAERRRRERSRDRRASRR